MTATTIAHGRARRLAILASTSLVLASLFSGASAATAASGGKDHFLPTVPFIGAGEAGELRTPLEFEEEAAEGPGVSDQILFSRCRFDLGAKVYAPLGSHEHDAIVGDTSFGFADGTSCFNPQNEQNIVINPADSQNVVTSANEYRAIEQAIYVSKDGGNSWVNVPLAWTRSTGGSGAFSTVDSCGDPVLSFNADGSRLYFTQLVCNLDKFPRTKSGISIASSTDGGLHWTTPTMIDFRSSGDFFADKEWVAAGAGGQVYVTWTRFYQGPRGLGYLKSPIMISASRDGGKTWSSPKEVSDATRPFDQGSAPIVGPDGTLYVGYEATDPATGYTTDQQVVATSTDQGRTFTQHPIARVFDDFSCYPIQRPGAQDRQTLSYEQFRINSYPSLALDPSNGHLAMVWADDEGAGNCGSQDPTFTGAATSNQVKLVTSADGASWSSPRTITTGAADKVYPSVGANAGRIVVGYYTRAYSPSPTAQDRSCGIAELDTATNTVVAPVEADRAAAPVCLDWAIRSSDAANFGTETRVTSQSSNPYILFSGSFIGDYTGTAVDAAGHAVTVWTDFRGNPGVTTPNQDTLVGTGF